MQSKFGMDKIQGNYKLEWLYDYMASGYISHHQKRVTDCNCQSSTRAVRVLDGSQQKADVVKTDYSNSLLMITRM